MNEANTLMANNKANHGGSEGSDEDVNVGNHDETRDRTLSQGSTRSFCTNNSYSLNFANPSLNESFTLDEIAHISPRQASISFGSSLDYSTDNDVNTSFLTVGQVSPVSQCKTSGCITVCTCSSF